MMMAAPAVAATGGAQGRPSACWQGCDRAFYERGNVQPCRVARLRSDGEAHGPRPAPRDGRGKAGRL
jgi:hypothetical protein